MSVIALDKDKMETPLYHVGVDAQAVKKIEAAW